MQFYLFDPALDPARKATLCTILLHVLERFLRLGPERWVHTLAQDASCRRVWNRRCASIASDPYLSKGAVEAITPDPLGGDHAFTVKNRRFASCCILRHLRSFHLLGKQQSWQAVHRTAKLANLARLEW